MSSITEQEIIRDAERTGTDPLTAIDIINGRLYLNANYWRK